MMDQYDNLPNKISCDKLEEYGDNALGVKVIVVCHNTAFCGVIKHIVKDLQKIWLIKCFTYNDNIPTMGVMTLYYHDISFISVLKIDEEVKRKLLKRMVGESKKGKMLIMQRLDVSKQELYDNEELAAMPNGHAQNSLTPPPPPYGICSRPDSIEEINVANDVYTAAMDKINREPVVGLVVRGKALGRKGALGWISVATPSTLYHFDTVRLDFKEMLDTGFRTLLEHPHRVKVIHDARSFQDYLLYRHKCQLRKVFDIQLTDWYMQMRLENGKGFCLSRNFKEILKIALRFEDSHIPPGISDSAVDSGWMERPLPESMLMECDFCGSFLLEVRQVMMDKAISDLQHQTDVFVQSVSKMDQYSAEITEHMIIPQEVQNMWQKMSSDKILYREHPAASKLRNKFDFSYKL